MEKTEFHHMLEDLTAADPDSINDQTVLKSLDGWDSLTIVEFVAMVDEKLGIVVPAKQIKTCKTVEDLTNLFGDKIQ
jgi:acyl carrier protein